MQILDLPQCLQELVMRCLDLASIREWARCSKVAHAFVAEAERHAMEHLSVCNPSTQPNWFACILIEARQRACATARSLTTLLQTQDMVIVSSMDPFLPAKDALGYWVDITSHCHRSLFECLAAVAARRPQYVMVTCDDAKFAHTLQDHHVALLSAVSIVAVPGNKALTDMSIEHLSRCHAIWVSGCTGMTGDILPRCAALHNALLSIKWIGGWGADHPFNSATWAWLHKQETMGLIVNQR